MNFRMTRARLAAAGMGAAVVATLTVSASPASASASWGYVRGVGAEFRNDWAAEGTVSASSYARSNVACFWQYILWAEGADELGAGSDTGVYDKSDIDGIFGANTTHATKNLQARWGLDDDGLVGPNTFSKADDNLVLYSGNTSNVNSEVIFHYEGDAHSFYVRRAPTSGNYGWYEGQTLYHASYNTRTCS